MDTCNLPQDFLEDMEGLLGAEYPAFLESYKEKPYVGLRINRLKISVEDFLKISPFELKPIPWVKDGFYFNGDDRPAKHPYYHAGLYYIQEPSAMAPASVLSVEEGDVVADLCAAPGGKSVQISSDIGEKGLLVSNDISASRLKALVKNIELAGVKNALVICTDPIKLTERFKNTFNKILIDAPCSGEGMFRRDVQGIKNWTIESRDYYESIQRSIINSVSIMLKNGGECTYSTCTFTIKENEGVLNEFLKAHSEFEMVELHPSLFDKGIVQENTTDSMNRAGRLWPHKIKGEGHFVAKLKKLGELKKEMSENETTQNIPSLLKDFIDEHMVGFKYKGTFVNIEGKIILEPKHQLNLKGLRVLRSGWYIGDIIKNRFEPSQSFAMGLKASEMKRTFDLKSDSGEVIKYLKGETIPCDDVKGWILVTVDGYPLGWGKVVDKQLKNKYPASWRMM